MPVQVSIVGKPTPQSAALMGANDPDDSLAALQVDADGNLLVNIGGFSPSDPLDVDLIKVLGETLSASNPVFSAIVSGGSVISPATSGKQDSLIALFPSSIGQKASAGSLSVVVASDQTVPVSGSLTVSGTVAATQSGTWNITNVSGTVSLPTGAATAAKQPALGTAGTASADVISVQGIASMTALKVDGSGVTQPVSGTVAATQSGSWSLAANQSVNLAQVAGATTATGNGTASGSIRVSVASDSTGTIAATQSGTWTVQPGNTANTTAWLVKEQRAVAATLANVNDTASSTTLLASNSSRLGATFYNDSTSSLYLKFGATASTTSFTVLIAPSGYYELPQPCYTGIIDGIWSSDASGACRTTEW